MLITILSKGRATKQPTLQALPKEIRDRTYVVVEPQDEEAYKILGKPLLVLPENDRGLWFARQWVLDYAHENMITKVVQMDDDLTFARRRDDDPTKFRAATDQDMLMMIGSISAELATHVHVAVASREGTNRRTELYIHNLRASRVHGWRADKLRGLGLRWDNGPVKHMIEDFWMELSLLTHRYPHQTINWMVQNQAGSGATGGCEIYRTMPVQTEAALALKRAFPDFVKVVTKKTKTSWGGQERTDVTIQWKKAYEYGVANRVT